MGFGASRNFGLRSGRDDPGHAVDDIQRHRGSTQRLGLAQIRAPRIDAQHDCIGGLRELLRRRIKPVPSFV